MNIVLKPVRVAAGGDEEGRLVFADERLIAVLVQLSHQHDDLAGRWFLEVGFGSLDGPDHPVFADLTEARDWLSVRLCSVLQAARGGP